MVSQRNGLAARRARLIAEARAKTEIDFPKELEETAAGKKLIADETAFKTAREKRLTVQLAALDDLKKLLQGEVVSLDKKIVTQNRQIDLSKQELESIGTLAEQGLVVKQRILTIERQIADLEGKVLDMETAALRAKQDMSKATQDATNLQSDRDTEIAQDRQQAEADIQELDLKIAMYRDLMSEAMETDPQAAMVGAGRGADGRLFDRARGRRQGNRVAADESRRGAAGRRRQGRHRRHAGGTERRFPGAAARENIMKIAKAWFVDPDRNLAYGFVAVALSFFVFAYSTRFGQVSILAYYALWFPLILIDYRQSLGNYGKFLWIIAFATLACLSVFWSAAPGVTARAGVQYLPTSSAR